MLASFLAMASEATVLYLELVRVFATGKDALAIKAAIVTWSKQAMTCHTYRVITIIIIIFSHSSVYSWYFNCT